MLDTKTMLSIASIVSTSAIGIIGLVIDSKKTNKLTNEDIELVADKTADKVIEKLGIMPEMDQE